MSQTTYASELVRWLDSADLTADFLDANVSPIAGTPTLIDRSVCGLYIRARWWLDTLRKTRTGYDYQAWMAGARACLESAVDATLLARSPDVNVFDKLHAWENSALLHAARREERFAAKTGGVVSPGVATFLATEAAVIEQQRVAMGWVTNAGTRHPQRWTERSLETDCDLADTMVNPALADWRHGVGFASAYAQIYGYMCWGTHGSSLLGMRWSSPDDLARFSTIGALVVQQLTLYIGGVVLDRHSDLSKHHSEWIAFLDRRGSHAIMTAAIRTA